MKKNYSVKEAANLLDVSTNTLYKYLDEGKIKSRRIGQGRFKIPAKELEPFLETSGPGLVASPEVTTKQWVVSNPTLQPMPVMETTASTNEDGRWKMEDGGKEKVESGRSMVGGGEEEYENNRTQTEDIRSGVNDIVFYRIFKTVVFLGLGCIYLFSTSDLFGFELQLLSASNQLLLKLLPIGLILSGIFNLLEVISPKKFVSSHLLFDAFSVVVLSVYSYLSITSSQWGLFVFAVSITAIAISHLISGVKGSVANYTFFETFGRFTLFLTIVGGIVIVIVPTLIPVQYISDYVESNKNFFVFLWFLLLAAPAVYILTPNGRKSSIRLPFFVLAGTLGILVAVNLTFVARWDTAYLCFLTAIFSFFIAWWIDGERILSASKVWIVFLCFIWVSATIVFGLFSLNISREEIKLGVAGSLDESIAKLTENINNNFTQKASVLTHYAGTAEVKENLIGEPDQEQAIAAARAIYDQLGGVSRVIIYDINGVALGVYPRNSLFQGTNFSTQGYFTQTLKTYRPYISPLFENIAGEPVITQTEPVYNNNEFIGMIGVSYDLRNFADYIEISSNYDYSIKGIDREGFVVFSSNEAEVGGRDISVNAMSSKEEYITTTQSADIPGWKIYLSSQVAPAVERISNLNITLSVLLVVNALFSVTAGVIAAKKKEGFSETPGLTASEVNLAPNPRFI